LEPRGRGIVACTLRAKAEVRDPQEVFGQIPEVRSDPKMVEIAARIIEQQEGPFDPAQFTDRYETALRKLIEEKEKHHGRTVSTPEPQEAEVIDLMEALRRSLGEGGARRKPTAKAPAHPPRKQA